MTEGAPHEYKEKAGACAECGNSPINHLEAYFVQTFTVWASGPGTLRSYFETASVWMEPLFEKFERALCAILAVLPITRFLHDPAGANTYRSQVIWEEAIRRGISMEQMSIFGIRTELYRAKIRDRWEYFLSLPVPAHMRSGAHIDDKFLLKHVLARAGIPAPRVVSVTRLADAIAARDMFDGPVAVKPRTGTRGRHTTVNVHNDPDMARAFRSAQQLCRYVAIEEYLEGSVCRGTVVNGKLAGFFKAEAPTVIGDGRSTIAELIERTNADRPERVQSIELTDEHTQFITRAGFTIDSILPTGTTVSLTHRTGRLFGGRTRELLGSEHPKMRAYLERAAEVLGAPVVGFDLIIRDPEADPDEQRWGIIEANSLPYIDLHYLPLEGTPSNVAGAVWDLWNIPTRFSAAPAPYPHTAIDL